MSDAVSTIFIDMDGVLVDFTSGICSALGKEGMEDQIDNWEIWNVLGITETEFWAPCASECFWENLRWTEEGTEILARALLAVGPENVFLFTSPADFPRSFSGKAKWIKAHLPNFGRQVLMGPAKYLYAKPGHLLIDDSDINVKAFRAAGGQTILVPRPWNVNRGKPVIETITLELGRYQYV